jgi:tetratricopeptide (TPR) repeat protein
MGDSDFIWRFTPSRTEPELLEAIFVQRESLLQDLLERIVESVKTKSKHHVLLIGPRGFGKTHLITLVNHRLAKNTEVAGQIRIAWLLEDETITSFVQLLRRIYELLAQRYPEEFPLSWLHDLLDSSPDQIQQALHDRLIESFADKTLLVCVENLDYLFDGLKEDGQQLWRAFLQEHPFTTILASTQRLFNDVKKREKPFFGFFAPVHLNPLQPRDAVELLQRVADHQNDQELVSFLTTPDGRSRVRALHHLAGGNHRIYIVLSGFITRNSLDELVEPFQKMADELTPYYQERMRWLSAQQRQIVEFLSSQTRPHTPKQIARHLMAAENTVSGQMKKLMELGYVLRSPRGRESLYELAEPLMRLASEVKEQHRKPLQLLVDFLRVWYRSEELPGLLKSVGTDSLRRHVSAAIEASESSPDPRFKILDEEIEQAKADGRTDDLLQVLEEKAHAANTPGDWLRLGYWLGEAKRDFDAAIACYDRAIEIDPNYAYAWYNKGFSLHSLQKYEQAIECYERAIKIDPNYANAWTNKGNSLNNLQKYEQAIKCYERAIEIDPNDACPAFNRVEPLFSLRRWEEGFRQLRSALEQFGNQSEHDEATKIEIIRSASGNREANAEEFSSIYAEAQALTQLGNGLVKSLGKIDASLLSEKALYQWRDVWIDMGSGHVELEMPLRIFRVGIEYLAKHDEKVLLDLVLTERRLLQQALNLNDNADIRD